MMDRWVFPSRHRKAQRLAAAAHVDDGKSGGSKTLAGAVALFANFELVLARAEWVIAAPVQRPLLEFDGPVFGINGFCKAENPFRLTGDVRMQAFARIDPIPAAADHRL